MGWQERCGSGHVSHESSGPRGVHRQQVGARTRALKMMKLQRGLDECRIREKPIHYHPTHQDEGADDS